MSALVPSPTAASPEATHTPGPWHIIARPGEFEDAFWIGPEPFHSIAAVRNGADDEEYGGDERREANAHLVAAAPDLLAALRTLDLILDLDPSEAAGFAAQLGMEDDGSLGAACAAARAAIRLALTGERSHAR